MLLDGDVYGVLFQKWVVPNEDEDAAFGLLLKPDAPPEMRNLFNQLRNKMRSEVQKRSEHAQSNT